jgi:ABC-type multidrug transport system fused ATPase/permease subunit
MLKEIERINKDSKPKTKGILWHFISVHWIAFAYTLLFGVIANVFTILIPISISKYYSILFETNSNRAFILDVFPGSWVNSLPNFLWFFLGLIVCWMFFTFLQRFNTGLLGERFVKSIRESLFAHQLTVQMTSYDATGFGKYLLRYSGDMTSIRNYLTLGIIRFIIDLLLVVLAFIAMFWINWMLTCIVLGGIVLIYFVVILINKTLYKVTLTNRNRKSGLLSFVSSRLPLVITIKGFNRQTVEVNNFNVRSRKIYKMGVRFQWVYNLVGVIVPGMLYLTLLAILITVYFYKKSAVNLHMEHLLGFILLFITVLPVFRRLIRVSSIWKVGEISFEKLQSVYNLKKDPSHVDAPIFRFKRGNIEFNQVNFAYSDDTGNVLDDFSLSIQGSKVNVVCQSTGLPKSTLIKLLIGIYTPITGSIKIDGQKVNRVHPKSLKRRISILSEDFPLLGDTVFEASAYNLSDENRQHLQVLLDEIQDGLPEETKLTLDYKIGERGRKLTEHQRQIVFCLRCFMTNKPIILIENFSKYASNPAFNSMRKTLKRYAQQNKTVVLFESKPSHLLDDLNPVIHELS